MNIFELLKEPYKLPKKTRLFEAFAGIGCQRLAFEKAQMDYELVGISEIDKAAIKTYEAIHGPVKNYGNIMDIKGNHLPEIDVFTYSFPCTDLSKAGQQKGMNTTTRSGLIFEVLRILQELKEINKLPKVLIMENVVDLVQSKFIRQFQEIQYEIEQMGYTNYTFTMNAKHYGVAQNRDRVFMVSILGDYYYEQPEPIPLQKKLKDYLEPSVDEKYYLSDKMLKYFTDPTDRNGFIRNDRFNPHETESQYAFAITTNAGNRPTDNFIKIPEKTIKGYAEASDGDGVYLNRPHQKRGVVQKGMIQTIKTTNNDLGVVIGGFTEQQAQMITPDGNVKRYLNSEIVDEFNVGDSADISFPNGYDKGKRTFKEIAPTLNLTTSQSSLITKTQDLRIRKITPREAWRLMGINDKDYDKAIKVTSNAQLYKQAGNGIVIDVFAKIVEKMKGE